ncbi:asparagine--tRNA ligase [Plakobranchus ocellatus]|uniref:asparagine--tRNA ligase n=1 Tax=Plakobranchus ocellatus TaxID=259542 RepID=A0AAV3YI87_9GAST|nr:asparagine--tRNA ligase [Plakobranchus ocellatus]
MAAPLTFPSALLARTLLSNLNSNLKCVSRANAYTTIQKALDSKKIEQEISVKGWVKNLQSHKGVMFLHVNDGSGPQHLQVIVPQPLAQDVHATFGSCVEVTGVLKESLGKGQNVELLSSSVDVIGPCDPFDFPIKQRARHSPQYMRDYLHLRPKSNLFSALLRIRNVASMAIHSFFQNEGYVFIHTPILVTNDCEGACEIFKVEPLSTDVLQLFDNEDFNESGDIGSGPHPLSRKQISTSSPSSKGHFFGDPVYLTVSGQLHLEVMTGAFTKVYNFGPCFRAENSHGSFHLSEFYMVEAELAFISKLDVLLKVMEELVKHVYKAVMSNCPEDVALFLKFVAPPEHKMSTLKMMESQFERLTYADAIQMLERSDHKFKQNVSWGCDLDKEHEMYLTKAVGERPVFVTDYPAKLKPFYALRNDDDQTVAACDLLVPGVGELCGSSLREHRPDVLREVIAQHETMLEQIPWYQQLRDFGTCPHGGMGLGFERLLLAILGAGSVKDVIPFPRWTGRCLT